MLRTHLKTLFCCGRMRASWTSSSALFLPNRLLRLGAPVIHLHSVFASQSQQDDGPLARLRGTRLCVLAQEALARPRYEGGFLDAL